MGQTHLKLEKEHLSHSFFTEQIFLFTFLLFLTPPSPPYSPTAWDNVNGVSVLHSVGRSENAWQLIEVKAPSASTKSIYYIKECFKIEKYRDDYVLASL